MENSELIYNLPSFNEDEWIRLIFQLNDTQNWLNELVSSAVIQVPMKERKKLFRKTSYISVAALAHIIERHYYKILRHPQTSKFTIPIVELLSYLRDASAEQMTPVSGSINYQRVFNTGNIIGFDRNRISTTYITILTDSGGRIITAFPGNKVYNANNIL